MRDRGTTDLVRFLDAMRAAEAAGAEVVAAWVGVCTRDALRGGLRVIASREAGHAELLALRLSDLGAPCVAEVSGVVRAAAVARFGSAAVSDEEKLASFLARYPDDAAVAAPIVAAMAALEADAETREVLRLVAEGETATVAWLRAYHKGLGRHAWSVAGPAPVARTVTPLRRT
jgi:hypothetical protein